MMRSKTRTGGFLSSEAGRAVFVVCHGACLRRYAIRQRTTSAHAAIVEGQENHVAEKEAVSC